jgi:hypothetical protein
MTAHLEMLPPPLAGRVQGVDERIEAALIRALAKQPDERFSSVEEFGRAIGANAIRGDAQDILRDFFAATFDRGPSPELTRLLNTPGVRAAGASENIPDHRHDEIGVPRRLAFPLLKQLPEPMRLPAAILGAAIAVFVVGFGYLVWSAKETPRVAQVPPAPSPQPQPPTPPKEGPNSSGSPQQRPLPPVPAPQPAQPAPTPKAPLPQTPAPTPPTGAPNTPNLDFVLSYDEGLKDRANWERWFAGLSGPFHTGAFWWSGQRSLDQPGACNGPASLGDLEFAAGCEAAKARLTPADIKRNTNPDYRRGWNSYSPEVGLLPQSTEPAANCGGNTDSQIIRPITLLYTAVNRKDIDLYAQQWADDAKYLNVHSQLKQNKEEKIKSKISSFSRLRNIIMQMDRDPKITYKTANSAEVEVVYSTTYTLLDQSPLTERGIHEKYTITCYPNGKWLISSNVDEISSAGSPSRE